MRKLFSLVVIGCLVALLVSWHLRPAIAQQDPARIRTELRQELTRLGYLVPGTDRPRFPSAPNTSMADMAMRAPIFMGQWGYSCEKIGRAHV